MNVQTQDGLAIFSRIHISLTNHHSQKNDKRRLFFKCQKDMVLVRTKTPNTLEATYFVSHNTESPEATNKPVCTV